MGRGSKGTQILMTGYRPVVRAREGRMLGLRQPPELIPMHPPKSDRLSPIRILLDRFGTSVHS